MPDLLHRTACGLYVMGDGKPKDWSNFSWVQEIVDMPGDAEEFDAIRLIQTNLMETSVGIDNKRDDIVMPIDVAFATMHDGIVDRIEGRGLNFSDPEVPGNLIDRDRESQVFTVCGIRLPSWRGVCFRAEADLPLVAYCQAWRWCLESFNEYLLLCAVHDGEQPDLAVFEFADPLAKTEVEMQLKATNEWQIRNYR